MKREFKPAQAFGERARPPIALNPVESHKIKAVGYDEATKTLAVQFNHGAAIYHYPDVSAETHKAFIASESLGKFHTEHILPLPFEKFHLDDAAATAEA
jgi:hypothetical protein